MPEISPPPGRPVRARRSELATPASSERMCEKAAGSGADLVFLDLEDACAPSVKEQARSIAVGALTGLDWGRTVRAVRVNGLDTPWCHDDIIEVVTGAAGCLDVIILPKARTGRDVWWADVLLTQLETKLGLSRRIGLEVLIEESEGLANAVEIARSSDRLEAVIFGAGDLSASQRARVTGNFDPRTEYPGDFWHFARVQVVTAARVAGIDAIDAPYPAYQDPDGYRRAATHASLLGFDGKWAIHPDQIAIAHEVFSPTPEEVEAARRSVETYRQAEAGGGGSHRPGWQAGRRRPHAPGRQRAPKGGPGPDPGGPTLRPLPELTPFNSWFWTSGADGRLRIQGCTDCGKLVHPPVPICPACGGRSSTPTPVSGLATVIGFTVNHHRWLPGFDPPYVVANVALAEDPGVRLTTNIVGADPEAVHVGQEVEVAFEPHDDVWLPLFRPTGGADRPDPVGDPVRPAPRAAPTPERFEHRAVLSGVGRSAIGRRLMVNPLSLTIDACLAAVADAGLDLSDIDGLSTYPGPAGMGMSEGGVTAVEEALRLHPTWINGGGELPGPGGSVIAVVLAVAAGLCRHVLCFRTVWESTFATLGMRGQGGGRASGMMEYRAPFGAMSAANWIGINANRYMHRYGATRELLGYIALNGRANAARNPAAIYRDPMTMDDYLSARPISSPFGLYDCDVPCDASIAVIVSDASVAADLPKPGIRIEAVGTQIQERVSWDQGTVSHEPQVIGQSAHLWSRTDLGPADVDLALLYDGFTFNAISWLEGLGFCGFGEAQDWLDGGRRIAPGGELAVNPHGGQLSEGRTHGFGFLYEAVVQLRHEAGDRQVPGARTAVVTSGGGTPSGVLLLQRPGA